MHFSPTKVVNGNRNRIVTETLTEPNRKKNRRKFCTVPVLERECR